MGLVTAVVSSWFSKPQPYAPTPEEEERRRVLIAEQAASLERTHEYLAAAKEENTRQKAEKRDRVKTVGEIRKVGKGRYETTGWEIDVPDGSGRGRVVEDQVQHTGTLAGYTVAELCAMAHGPRCRSCR